MNQSWWHYVVGYSFAMLAPLVFPWGIRAIGELLWVAAGGKQEDRDADLATIVGFLETGLYATSYLLDRPEFIGAWLVLKVAGGWKGWQSYHKGVHGRRVFQIFLIGTGLSVAYGVMGALIIGWLDGNHVAFALAFPLMLLVVTVAIWIWACKLARANG